MKTTIQEIEKEQEAREIGELIQEITASGFNFSIDVDDRAPQRFVTVEILQMVIDAEHPQSNLDQFGFDGQTIADALGAAVDAIRHEQGKPTLAEEVAELLTKDSAIDTTTLFTFGPDACCAKCKSRSGLVVERKHHIRVSWFNGTKVLDHEELTQELQPGEILSCVDCGHSVKIQPS